MSEQPQIPEFLMVYTQHLACAPSNHLLGPEPTAVGPPLSGTLKGPPSSLFFLQTPFTSPSYYPLCQEANESQLIPKFPLY